jgi:hypothetical protein
MISILHRGALYSMCAVVAGLLSVQAWAAQSSLPAELGAGPRDLSSVGQIPSFRPDPVVGSVSGDDSSARSTNASDVVGTLSIEDFQGTQSSLNYTHESAAGFRNYLATWYAPNFIFQDSGVGVSQYHDFSSYNYDQWNSGGVDYGIDGALTVWHSGHGDMYSSGTFVAPMGYEWAGQGWNAYSSDMALGGNYTSFGDETLRYMFWDTCYSNRYSGGQTPVRTWGAQAKGVRFVFGYETTSVDSPNYGSYFWEEWNRCWCFSRT